jgi:hypothetical protein
MVKKGELTDEAWARIAPLLTEIRRGGRWRVHHEAVNGIFPRCHQCLISSASRYLYMRLRLTG